MSQLLKGIAVLITGEVASEQHHVRVRRQGDIDVQVERYDEGASPYLPQSVDVWNAADEEMRESDFNLITLLQQLRQVRATTD
jgi:hypothetical protein